MAKKYAIADGVWSNPAIWFGGTVPTSADDVYPNGFTVAIDQNITVLSLTNVANASAPTIAPNGTFTVNNGITVTANGGGFIMNTVSVLQVNGSNSCTIAGTPTRTTSSALGIIQLLTTGTVNVVTNVSMSGGGNAFGISIGANAIINIIGDVLTTSTSGANVSAISITSNCTLNIMGMVASGASVAIISTTSYTCNITGSTTANGSVNTFSISQPTTLNFTGNVTTTSTAAVVNTNSVVTGTVVGVITASASSPAIINTAAGSLWTISGPCINNSYWMAMVVQRLRILNSSTTSWLYQTETAATKTLYTPGVALGNPSAANVRSGTIYGPANDITGTLQVPLAINVASGVPVDNTVGLAQLSAADFWNYLAANANTVGSIGKLLHDNINATISSRLATAGYTAPANAEIAAIKAKTDAQVNPDNAGIALIKAKTDNLPADPASLAAIPPAVADFLESNDHPIALRYRSLLTEQALGAIITALP